jgi:predicted RNase H-like HicB family nuclease
MADLATLGYPDAMSLARFTAALTQDDDWYVAQCLEVDVASQGHSVEEALASLREALELYFEDQPAPELHGGPIIAPVDVCLPA